MPITQIDNPSHIEHFLESIHSVVKRSERDFIFPIFVDVDDTMIAVHETMKNKRPVHNQLIIKLLAKIIHRVSLSRLKFHIVTTRQPDQKISGAIAYLRISTALPGFHNKLNAELATLRHDTVTDLFEDRIYYCDPGVAKTKLVFFQRFFQNNPQSVFAFIDDQLPENCIPVRTYFSNALVMQSVVQRSTQKVLLTLHSQAIKAFAQWYSLFHAPYPGDVSPGSDVMQQSTAVRVASAPAQSAPAAKYAVESDGQPVNPKNQTSPVECECVCRIM